MAPSMATTLPTELWMSSQENGPCRIAQLQLLATLYNDAYPPPRNLVVHGLRGTGKLQTVRAVLAACQTAHIVVRSRECLSLRHLLSKIYSACIAAIHQGEEAGTADQYESRCESVNALSQNLQRLVFGRSEKLVVVLDGIDKQRGLNPHTLPALARLSDIVPNLCLILIVSTPRALFLQKAGIPYLHFPPYTRPEAISLVIRSSPSLAPQDHLDDHQDLATLQKWYSLFATTVYDSLVSQASLSPLHFRRTCEALWPRFIWPYINGDQPPGKGKNGKWDFQKLLVRQRPLFQAAGEETLAATLLPSDCITTFAELRRQHSKAEQRSDKLPSTNWLLSGPTDLQFAIRPQPSTRPLLPFFSALVLTAAYLASHTHQKLDILLFSRLSSSSRSARVKKSYHRRKLFQSPSKRRGATATGGDVDGGDGGPTTPKKNRTATLGKSGLELNLNLPRAFTLERLVAILRAIHPQGVLKGRSMVDKVSRHLAELERLRLLVPADGAGFGTTRGLDDGGAEERRWRVNVPRGFVEDLGGRYVKDGLGGLLREYELIEL